ncbi:ABC transporter permease [Tessaracoccus oleiagri]|uniref:ABC-2 type transport system permease protein n=1 Tax=Tessaracoccus oleiagri TaxID=686624 RepID=A0A1G9KGZ8_9ACTN|nr:ABC transporter permease [Tessaracoccus oleiagri]SDL48889.1 ABC-2 type transport system permease protein [Tessaracoccus oleiagri]
MSTANRPKINPRPSFSSSVGIVAQREIRARILSKSFLISTIITLLVILLVMVLMPRMEDLFGGNPDTVAVVGEAEQVVAALGGDEELTVLPDDAAAREAVLAEEVDVAVVPDATNPVGVKIYTLDDLPTEWLQKLSVAPSLEILDTEAADPGVLYVIALGFGIVWMMSAITFGMSIANSVVEEKQTRIVEILLATVSARSLLTGKIVGNSLAALVQIGLIVATVFLGMAINGDQLPTMNLTAPILWFVALFLVGFVMIASLYAAAAALVSRPEDLANVQQPIMWLVMLPYFAIIFAFNNPLALQVMSYIPFSAPVAVPLRVFTGEQAWWEPVLSLGILFATTLVIIWFAARVYENALLRTGKPVKWREALNSTT